MGDSESNENIFEKLLNKNVKIFTSPKNFCYKGKIICFSGDFLELQDFVLKNIKILRISEISDIEVMN